MLLFYGDGMARRFGGTGIRRTWAIAWRKFIYPQNDDGNCLNVAAAGIEPPGALGFPVLQSILRRPEPT